MGDDRGRRPLDRVKDAVAAALRRRSGAERTDDETRRKVGELAEPVDPGPRRTAGMVYRPGNTPGHTPENTADE